jgi:hypothetical protein
MENHLDDDVIRQRDAPVIAQLVAIENPTPKKDKYDRAL